jgi:hypothetical protein
MTFPISKIPPQKPRYPQSRAQIAVFSGAVAILTRDGSVVMTPALARQVMFMLGQAANRAETFNQEPPHAFSAN